MKQDPTPFLPASSLAHARPFEAQPVGTRQERWRPCIQEGCLAPPHVTGGQHGAQALEPDHWLEPQPGPVLGKSLTSLCLSFPGKAGSRLPVCVLGSMVEQLGQASCKGSQGSGHDHDPIPGLTEVFLACTSSRSPRGRRERPNKSSVAVPTLVRLRLLQAGVCACLEEPQQQGTLAPWRCYDRMGAGPGTSDRVPPLVGTRLNWNFLVPQARQCPGLSIPCTPTTLPQFPQEPWLKTGLAVPSPRASAKR